MAAEREEQQVAAAAADEEQREAASSEDDEECGSASESGDSTEGESEGGPGSGSKSKKKKKKKRKGGGAAAAGGGAQPPVDPEARKEGERRFQAAVEQLAHNSEDSMWVKLGGCHLADGKLKKLCEALRANTTVISLDLSANHFTDEGAKALAAALRDGRAPDLIDLDLKDNPQIKEEGAAALEELQQQRKTLRVALGSSVPPPPPQQQQQPGSPKGRGSGQPGSPKGRQQGGGGAGDSGQQQQQHGANGTMADTVKNNPVISKYFSVGNDEAEDGEEEEEQQQAAPQQQQQQQQQQQAGGGGGEEEQQSFGGLTEAELAQILWDQLEQCLNAATPDIPSVSEPLRAIAEQVEHEMDNSTLPLPPAVEMGELRTFTQWALRKLHVLHSVLDLVPPPILTPYSKGVPVSAVGTHRAAVAELLAQLLRAEAPVVAQLVAASGVLRRCAKIAVAHPNCSAIHGAVARCLKLSLSKPVGQVGLWHQLFGSAPLDAHGGAISDDHGSSLNLAVEAAAIAKAAQQAPTIGKRASNVGFALAIGQLLHAATTGEQLGAAKRAAEEAAAAAAAAGSDGSPAGGSPPPEQQQQGGSSGGSSGGGSEGGSEEPQQQGASPPGSAAASLAEEDNPLKEKPLPPGFGLRRISSSSAIPRAASAAVSDMPDDKESWTEQLHVQLSTEDAWVEFSTGPECLLRTLLAEHEGDLGGPRPRPGGDPEPDSGDEDVSPGQIISGQELLMMLRGLNLGGFSGGM